MVGFVVVVGGTVVVTFFVVLLVVGGKVVVVGKVVDSFSVVILGVVLRGVDVCVVSLGSVGSLWRVVVALVVVVDTSSVD